MTLTRPDALAEAIEHCRRITRRRARNFYYGLKLAPEPQRSALFVVYAWMRTADDLVDSASGGGSTRLEQVDHFRAATDAALSGRVVGDDPLWIALSAMAREFDIRREDLHSMLDGQVDDLSVACYETFAQLRQYCYRVASTVGLICIGIWGYDNPDARDLAVSRGIAFQLTNIIRDFRQDYDAGRVYLPQEDFDHYQISPRQMRDWSKPEACRRLLIDQIRRAESFYDAAAGLDEMITPSCRPTLWAMTTIYRQLLERMRRDPSRIVLGRRVRLSTWQKATIALRARCMARPGAPVVTVVDATNRAAASGTRR